MNSKEKLHLAQQEVYYGQLTNPQSPIYNIGGYTIFKGTFNVPIFKKVIEGLSKVFDAFNIRFDFSENEPSYYLKDRPESVLINELDFSLNIDPRKFAEEWMQNQFNIAFDLHKEKLYRYTLIKITEDEYWWFVCFHHLIADGFGFAIKVNYVIDQYEKLFEGSKTSTIPYPSYTDAISRSVAYLESEYYQKDAIYWKEKYNFIPKPVLEYKKLKRKEGGGRFSVLIPESDRKLFNVLSQQTKANLSQFTVAALLLYFGKTTDQEIFSFGVPVHNRGSREDRKTLGMFSGILPYKGKYIESQTLSSVISDIRQTQRNDYRHRLYPISHLNRSLNLLSENRFQVFDVMVNYEPLPFPKSLSSGLHLEIKHLTSTLGLHSPLSIRWCDYGQDSPLELNVDYQLGYFDEIEIETLVKRLLFILKQFEFSLDKAIKDISILPKEEIKLLEDFNATEVDYPKEKTIVDLFLEQVSKTPEAIAVVFEGEELSYKELDNRSNQLGHYLQDQGVEPDDLVGICLDRSLEMLIGILGILKSGGAYVPIDPEYPKDRIDYMLDDAGIRLVLSIETSVDVIANREDLSVFMLDRDWSVIKSYPTNRPDSILCSSDLAYVIYTSGSTGKPKGVMNEHGGIVNRLLWTQSAYQLTSLDRVLQKTSFSFDVSVWEFFWPLISGAKLILSKPEGHKDGQYLKDIIEDQNITTIHFVPSMLHVFLESIDLGDCSSLRRVLCSGESLRLDDINLFKEKFTGVRLENLYGPTEAAIDVTFWGVPLEETLTEVLIGMPVSNTSLYILNDQEHLLPIGVVGELCIGGDQVARGYLNKEELTKEKFIVNPFKEGDRIYKTGDLARWTVDGTIEYIGRKDNQVKIRGYRIELGEIENALSSLAFINQCCVLAKEDVNGNKRLIGYVVVEGDLDKTKIQEELKESLPDYMVPGIWVELDAMPLTSNGKLDRKSLPDPDTTELSSKEYVAARNEIELELVKIWQELLGVNRVGIYDNFFELGGHSLLVIQLISRLQASGFHIRVQDVFGSPTIISISDKLSSVSSIYSVPDNGITVTSDHITPSMVPLVNLDQSDLDKIVGSVIGGVSNIQDIYPLSPLQEGIHFHHMMSDKNHGDLYILPSLLSFSDKEKRNSFIEALQFVVSRHDVLRTCIKSEGLPTPVQVVLREVTLYVEEISLDDSKDILSQLKLLTTSGSQWMDISRAPLLELKSAEDVKNDCYYLMINQHHLILDHVGLEKVISEVTMYLSGDIENLPVPVLYRDFIGHTLHSQSINDSESYFRSLLGGIDEPAYPFGLSNVLGGDIKESSILLSEELSKELRNICGKLGISPAVLFHAAYGLVVGRCSNKEQVIFGSLFSGRLQGSLGAADSLGLFINTLPILLELKGSVSEYLKEVKKRLEELLPYEQTPLSHIQNWSGTSNNVALFSALLNYRHTSIPLDSEDENTIDLGISVIESHERTNYPFTLNVDDFGVDFGLTAQVDKSIGSDRVITYMKEILVQLLEELQKESEVSIDNLGILPKEEEIKLLEDFNATEVDYPKEKTIVDLFLEQVTKTPEAIAVVFEGEELSYKELDNRSNQLGHYLQDQGVEPDDLVGICLDRSLEMLIGILGILKSGGAYVPIDPEYPKDRIDYMLDDAGIRLVLSIETSVDVIANREDLSVFMLDRDWSVISDYPTNTPESILCPSHLAYVIYTSGSTGKPKGVLVSHVSLLNFILSMVDRLEMKGIKSFLSVTTFTFDIFYLELFSPLLLGAKVIVLDSNSIRDGDHFISAIADYSPDFMQATPSTWQMLVDHGWDNREGVTILTGGEALKESLKNRLTTISNRVWNLYGPTETTIWVTAQQLDFLSSVTIGMPVSNTSLYILNDQEHLLPIGVVGELCIGGDQVARGYLNKEDLTKEKFIVNPFKEGDRIYKTGDLARWTVDGTIEYIGRKDNQVKIRGYRIELGEIENALSSLAFINQCCVLAKEDVNGNKRLIGYVVVEGDLDKTKIQEELKGSLPDYMVPGIWVELDTMPLTSNGKLDRKSLPDPDTTELSSKEYVAARNEIELQLVEIWQELLGVDRVGIYDDFFELGGHSLLATRLVSMIRKELEVEISIREIFSHTTISSLGSHVSVQSEGVLLPSIVIEDRPTRIPLSFSQERLWFLDQLEGTSSYHIPIVIQLEGRLAVSVLEKSLQSIVSRHEVLRTNILSAEGVGYQEVVKSEDWFLDHKYVSDQEGLDSILNTYLAEPFDLSKDYKLRACLYDLGNDNYVLACVFHHIAGDGWSSELLVKEFTELYSAFQSGRAPVLPDLSLQYSDYAIWQRKYLEGEVLENQLSYWEDKLEGVSTLSLPTDYDRPVVQSSAGGSVSLELDKELSDSLDILCREEGVTLFMVLLSGFKVLLSRYSGQEDICVGSPIANRTQSDLEGMIGFFVNTLALRSELRGDLSFRELLGQVKATTLGGYDHQLVPFEKVVDRVITTRDMSRSPLFQVLFSLQNWEDNGDQAIDLEGLELSLYESELNTKAQFDLLMSAKREASHISFHLVYRTSLYKKSSIINMLSHYKELLRDIVCNPGSRLGDLTLLRTIEKEELLVRSTGFFSAIPEVTIMDLFDSQVSKTPTAVALVYGDTELSYIDLYDRSNCLASHLQNHYHISTGDYVGVMQDRSDWSIISILGILKSGGVYVPIDVGYPSSRKSYIIDDTGLKVLLIKSDHLLEVIEFSLPIFTVDLELEALYKDGCFKDYSLSYDSEGLAYVIYTSGSTGDPKGVPIRHSSLTNYIINSSDSYIGGGISGSYMHLSMSFDASLTEIFTPLVNGKLLVISSTEGLDVFKDKNLRMYAPYDFIKLTPSHLELLSPVIEESPTELLSKRYVLGGESLLPVHLSVFRDLNISSDIINEYGPTESTVGCSTYVFNTLDDYSSMDSFPIGVPMRNMRLYILDDFNQLVPQGVIGELCIGGFGLSPGYLNKEELTKDKFIANPFIEGEKIYRTGDLSRWLPDGNIDFIGRKDNQVKIRGYRIELGEIENALSSLVFINQCCVLAKEDVNGNKRLIGYVVVEGDLDKTKIQEELKESLPDYMVPGIWVELDAMPLTSNGKLDRKSLPDPDTTELSSKEYVAARNEIELELVKIWQELLGVDRVGIYDNFFELGGHSLLAVQLISRLQLKGFHIEVKDIFENPIIISISDKLSSLSSIYSVPDNGITVTSDRITPSMVPLVNFDQSELDKLVSKVSGGVSNIQDIYPLSPLQEGIYFHHLMSDKNQGDPYVFTNLLSFSDKEKRNSFIEALQFVVNRHDVLRTCILSEGLPSSVQVVLRKARLSVDNVDLDTSIDVLSQLESLNNPDNQWMDVRIAPLLELKTADDPQNNCCYLMVNLHHLVLDHIGLEKVIAEIKMYLSGEESSLLPPVLYRDFIGHTLHSQSINDSESYFRGLFGNIDEPTYPFGLSNVLGDGSNIKESSIFLPEKLSKELRNVCVRLGMSPAVLFHAAYGIVIGKCSNREHAIFGSLFSGRLQGSLGAADSLGLFINTLPLILDLNQDIGKYLDQVNIRLKELLSHEQTPLSNVQGWSGISNDIALFSAILNYRHSSPLSESEDGSITDLGINVIESKERNNYPFTLNVDDYGVDFKLTAQIDGSIDSDLILVYVKQVLIQLLEGANSETMISVRGLNILSKEEESQLLNVFNNVSLVDYHKDKTVVCLFEEQAIKTPEAIALIFEEKQLTYSELDRRSNQLAHYLRNQGIQSGSSVGICLDRSLDMIIGILGVLKSGGVYVPIDPHYPKDRIDYMLKDADIGLVLSSNSSKIVLEYHEELLVLLLDKDWGVISECSINTLSNTLSSEGLAYVIYTSGSTGDPKGVPIRHSSLTNYIINSSDSYIGGGISGSYMHLSMSFDASLTEIFTPLVNGKLLVISSTEGLDVFKDKNLRMYAPYDFIKLTPSHLELLSPVIEESPTELLSKRYVLGGESLLPVHLSIFRDLNISSDIINEYGPTESTVGCSTYVFNTLDDYSSMDSFPIGVPMRNMRLYILDDFNQLVPQGVIGELCIGGFGLSPGYLNKEELTKEKFIANPFIEGEKIYRTGDLSRWLPDGTIDFIGRKDNQVKIRGYRIELGEIESVLSSLAFINQCCVLAKEDVNGNKRLIGYVVVEGDLDKTKIQEELKRSLPDYMVPGIWVELDRMPLTLNGKLDRKSLPDPDTTELSTKEYVEPRTDTEVQLVKIWQELLGVDRVGVYDNFFELGGHSLLATRLVSMIRKELNIEISIRNIFKFSTVEEISSYIDYKVRNLKNDIKEYSINIEI